MFDIIKQAEEESLTESNFYKLSQVLENKILNGNIDIDVSKTELESNWEILFKPCDKVLLEMPVVSSMVKELTPLVLYLRYLAVEDELIIIDEPEMNLHPEAQARLIEFLAMLVNAGLHIIITTYSPYLVDHLVNLIKAETCENKDSIKEKFFLKDTDAFISKDKVAAYLFEQGNTHNILGEDGLIDWKTFGNISDRISQIYFDL